MPSLSSEALDLLTRTVTAFRTFDEMVDAEHRLCADYFPILDTRDPATQLLADLYDQYQAEHCDPRRVWRGSHWDGIPCFLISQAGRRTQ